MSDKGTATRLAEANRRLRESRRAAQSSLRSPQKDLAEKSQHDKEYLEMKAKFEDMKKQLLEKDKWIVELGRTSEKSSKAVGEVKGSLEKTYQVKIKGTRRSRSPAKPAQRERAGSQSAEPDDRLCEQDGAGQDDRVQPAGHQVQRQELSAVHQRSLRRVLGRLALAGLGVQELQTPVLREQPATRTQACPRKRQTLLRRQEVLQTPESGKIHTPRLRRLRQPPGPEPPPVSHEEKESERTARVGRTRS